MENQSKTMNCKFCGAPFAKSQVILGATFTRFQCGSECLGDYDDTTRSLPCFERELACIKSELTAWRDLATALYKFLPRECSHEPGEACDICAAEKTYTKLNTPTK